MTNDQQRPSAWDLEPQLDTWRVLAQVVRDEGLSELTIESDGVTLTLKVESPAPTPVLLPTTIPAVLATEQIAPQPATATGAPLAQAAPASDLVPVSSPMVGVFYRSLSPDDPPLVDVGDRVEIGQTVGLVEAMKVFNEITSDVEGTVVEARAGNAELVETGSVLFLVKP